MMIRVASGLVQPEGLTLNHFNDESYEVSSYATAAEYPGSHNLPEAKDYKILKNVPLSSDSNVTVVHTPKSVLRFRELLGSLIKALDDVEIHIDSPKWRFASDITELGNTLDELWQLISQYESCHENSSWFPLFIRRIAPLIKISCRNSDMLMLLTAYRLCYIGPELSIPSEEYYAFVREVFPLYIEMVKKGSSIAKIALHHLFAKMRITCELVSTVINCRTLDKQFYAEGSVALRSARIIWINILLYRLSNFEVFSGSWALIESLQQELDRIIKEETNVAVTNEFFRYPGRHGDTYEETKCIYKLITMAEDIPAALRDDLTRAIELAKDECKFAEAVKLQRVKKLEKQSRHRSLQRKLSLIRIKCYNMTHRLKVFKI